MEETLTVTEFKAKCLDLFDRLSERRLDRVVVTRRGKTVAIVMPPSAKAEELRSLHGAMAGKVVVPAGLDLTAPIFDEDFDASKGILHR
ncbi:MAG TPA: prevent-host-death protein [Allosphingosinicella sp.]